MLSMKKTISFVLVFIFIFSVLSLSTQALRGGYPYSAPYVQSVYYQRLMDIKLTSDMRTNLVNVAKSQLGYHEGNSFSELNGSNKNGSGNYSEYGYWIGTEILDWGQGYFDAWCAMFVSWCARQAGIPESIIANAVRAKADSPSEVGGWYNFHVDWKYPNNYNPLPGDLIFFHWSTSSLWDHVGIVWYTTGTHVVTIEGNASDGVVSNTYPLNSPYILCYGIPAYTKYEGTPLGYELWRVKPSSGLNLRSGAGGNYSSIAIMPYLTEIQISEKVTVSGETWGKASFKGAEGWCNLGYCKYIEGKITPQNLSEILTIEAEAYIYGSNLILKTAGKKTDVFKQNSRVDIYRNSTAVSGNIATGDVVKAYSGNTLMFEKQAIVKGDITPDGTLDVRDYIPLRLYILGIESLSGDYLTAADFNDDGKITVTDYIGLRLRILGIQ